MQGITQKKQNPSQHPLPSVKAWLRACVFSLQAYGMAAGRVFLWGDSASLIRVDGEKCKKNNPNPVT
jgi:hypothetical protein